MVTVLARWRVAFALVLVLCSATSMADPRGVYDIDLRAQSLADALNGLSEQTSTPVVFPYDLVRDRKANPVIGRYSLQEALDALLKDTGLSGGLSDKGVLTVSVAKPGTPTPGESLVSSQQKKQNTNKTSAARPAGIFAFFASVAAAFSASADDLSSDSGNPETEVLITAEKRTERLQDVPVPVAVIDTQDLADNNKVMLRDYYSSVPGLVVMAELVNQATVTIRGISAGNAITVDDVPFGGSTTFSGSDYVPDFDPADLARIEVLKGPQGTLYGANSMGGLVKFITVDPSTSGFSGRVEAGTSDVVNGSGLGYSFRASANIPLSDTFAVRVSGYTRKDQGYIDNPVYHLNGVNQGIGSGGRLSALWKPVDDLSVKFSALYQRYSANGASEADIAPGLEPLQQNYLPGLGGYTHSVQADSLVIDYKVGAVQLTSVTGYSDNLNHPTLDFGYAFGKGVQTSYGVSGAPFLQRNETSRFSEELRAAVSLGSHFDWMIGGFFSHENAPLAQTIDAENTTTFQDLGVYYEHIQPTRFKEYAGFTNLTYHVTEKFDVQIGGREAHTELDVGPQLQTGPYFGAPGTLITVPKTATKNDSFTYLFTPRFKISENLMTYARFASGFAPGGPNPVYPGVQSSYGPEKTFDSELGLKGDFFNRALSVDASFYYVNFTDLVIKVKTGTANSVTYSTNAGKARSDGVDLTLTARPTKGLTVTLSGGYDDAVLRQSFPTTSTVQGQSGDRLPLTARLSGDLNVNQDFLLWGNTTGFVGGEASYIGDRLGNFVAPGQKRQAFAAYPRFDLHTGVRFNAWTANLYVNNIADRRGIFGGGTGYDPPNAFLYITPRTVGISLVGTF